MTNSWGVWIDSRGQEIEKRKKRNKSVKINLPTYLARVVGTERAIKSSLGCGCRLFHLGSCQFGSCEYHTAAKDSLCSFNSGTLEPLSSDFP